MIGERVEKFRALLLPDWRIHWCGDMWCQQDTKVIHMKILDTDDETLQAFLHEACHAIRGKGGHPKDFWDELKVLVKECLNQDLCQFQMKIMGDYLKNSPFAPDCVFLPRNKD